jgi:spore germination cell wall hydrolase CwlJ-like protein
MRTLPIARRAAQCSAFVSLAFLAACGSVGSHSSRSDVACLARAMYFESIRSSDEGMLAVGTVVMNRVESDEFPSSVCGVVGQKNQFAAGVLSRAMTEGKSAERAQRVARAVLSGKRHRGVGKAMYFHTAGRTYRYSNMHYVLVAGGNAFYTRKPDGRRNYIPRQQIAAAGPTTSLEAGRSWGRRNEGIAQPRHLLAAAPTPPARSPAPKPSGPAAPTIEELILASAGW